MAILTSEETIAAIRQRTDTVLLAFSCGKDSIGAWLAIKDRFPRIVPYYLYLVPGLEFVERSLLYYERALGTRIHRLPHPSLYRMLNAGVFQPPERAAILEAAALPSIDYQDVQDCLREDLGLPRESYVAAGVRAVDSPQRMVALRRFGPISLARRQFLPIWDWNKARLLGAIRESGLGLPVDYRLFGRSFDGIDHRFLAPIRDRFPADYRRILEWFPLADLEIARRRYAEAA